MTIQKAVRDALGIRQGSQLSWDLENGSVHIRPVAPLDLAHLQGIEAQLHEWGSEADESTFANL